MTQDISPDHVQVNVSIEDAGSPRESFSTIAFISHNADFPERARHYGTLKEVGADWIDSSPEHRACAAAFSQSPKPTDVAILRSTVSVTMLYSVGARSVVAGNVYALDVRGEGFEDTTVTKTPTVSGDAGASSVNSTLVTALNAIASKNFTAALLPLVVPDLVFTADNATEIFTAAAHGLKTGDGPVQVSNSGGALPTGLAAVTDYWVIKIDANTFYLATSLANAIAGTHLLISTNGTGTQTLSDTGATVRASSSFTVTGNAAGDWFSIAAQSIGRFDVARTHTVSGLGADLDAIREDDDSWYTVIPLYASPDYVGDLAAWAEGNEDVTVVFDINDSEPLLSTYVLNTSTDIGATLLGLGYTRTMGAYHHSPAEMLAAAWMGRILPSDPGSTNPKFKNLVGVSGKKLSTQQRTNLRARRMNMYWPYGGKSRTDNGVVFSTVNKWFDVTRNADWLRAEVQTNVFNIVASDVGFDEEGIQAVGGGIHQAFDTAIDKGVSSQSLPNYVTLPNIKDISDTDHGERLLQGIKSGIEFRGFIDRVVVDLNITP